MHPRCRAERATVCHRCLTGVLALGRPLPPCRPRGARILQASSAGASGGPLMIAADFVAELAWSIISGDPLAEMPEAWRSVRPIPIHLTSHHRFDSQQSAAQCGGPAGCPRRPVFVPRCGTGQRRTRVACEPRVQGPDAVWVEGCFCRPRARGAGPTSRFLQATGAGLQSRTHHCHQPPRHPAGMHHAWQAPADSAASCPGWKQLLDH